MRVDGGGAFVPRVCSQVKLVWEECTGFVASDIIGGQHVAMNSQFIETLKAEYVLRHWVQVHTGELLCRSMLNRCDGNLNETPKGVNVFCKNMGTPWRNKKRVVQLCSCNNASMDGCNQPKTITMRHPQPHVKFGQGSVFISHRCVSRACCILFGFGVGMTFPLDLFNCWENLFGSNSHMLQRFPRPVHGPERWSPSHRA